MNQQAISAAHPVFGWPYPAKKPRRKPERRGFAASLHALERQQQSWLQTVVRGKLAKGYV